jgi:integrase
MWFTALYIGMRAGELNALRKSKIELVSKEEALKLDNLEDASKKYYGKIQVEKAWKKSLKRNGPTKGRWWRTVPLNSKLFWFLVDYLETDNGSYEDGERVFPKISKWDDGKQSNILRFFLDEIGVKSVTFHTLRACFCTQRLESGVDRASIMKIGGWKSEDVMSIYIRLAGVDERGKTEGLDFGFSSSVSEDEQRAASIGANVINLFSK